ncbi:MAG: hypothetical protein WA734_02465 [Candidatus Acidiferrales bacterium]
MSDYIEKLRDAIRELHGVEAKHVASVPVKEVYQGKTVWEGVVEVFELEGHAKAAKAYAWIHSTDDVENAGRLVVVLGIPPVNSPEMAVKAAILEDYRERGLTEGS